MAKSIRDIKLFLLDLDGTVYIGDKLINGAAEFLDCVKENGCKYMFLTNNSSRGKGEYIKKMSDLGIESVAADFITSAEVTSEYLHRHYKGKKIYVLGNRSFLNDLLHDGHDVTDTYSEDIEVLVVGYDTELTYQKIKDACRLLSRGVAYIATNPDMVCPVEEGFVPECGAFVEILKLATGREPLFIGKPEPIMIEMAIERAGGCKEETVMVGDRLYTDIASGENAGVATALVLSGECTMADVADTDKKPVFVYKSIFELYKAIKEQ